MKQKYWLPVIFAALFCAGMVVGNFLNYSHYKKTPGQEKLIEVLNLISENYVDPVDIDSLVELTIPAMLSNLDPHSAYIAAKDYEEANSDLQGQFSGIGISFNILNDTLSVVEVISSGPAEKAGLLPGDKIVKVDTIDIAGKGIDDLDVRSMLRGEKGTHVKVQVLRHNTKTPLSFEIVRDEIPQESIDAAYMIEPAVGYVRISRFARTTYSEFLQALNRLRIEGAESFVLDLRNNTGGYMDPAVLIANELLEPGKLIVSTRGRDGHDQILLSDGSGAFTTYPVALIINEFTASSSEIFSGAIQDNDRGWIIGRRSFGKGLVQHPITFPDSSELRLTVQRYYTPSGRSIQKSYTPGDLAAYDADIVNRFNNGESLSADSIKLHLDEEYTTVSGRKVYGGGGIMPDVFVPEDTTQITPYYIKVANRNLLQRFAYEYADLNRDELAKAESVDDLLKLLPNYYVLLNSFVDYAVQNGVRAQWYYINISAPLIVNQIKGLIARNILGLSAYYQVTNTSDKAVQEALKRVKTPLIQNDEKPD